MLRCCLKGYRNSREKHEERNSYRQSTEGEDFKALLELFARMHTQPGIASLCVPYSVFRDLEILLRRITAIRGVPKGSILKTIGVNLAIAT